MKDLKDLKFLVVTHAVERERWADSEDGRGVQESEAASDVHGVTLCDGVAEVQAALSRVARGNASVDEDERLDWAVFFVASPGSAPARCAVTFEPDGVTVREVLCGTAAERARLDADGTAEPRTRLLAHLPVDGRCVDMRGRAADTLEDVRTGARTPLAQRLVRRDGTMGSTVSCEVCSSSYTFVGTDGGSPGLEDWVKEHSAHAGG